MDQMNSEVTAIIDEAVTIYKATNEKINSQLNRVEAALTTIREGYQKENVDIPKEIQQFTAYTNKLKTFQARIDRHNDLITNPDTPNDKKVAIIASMVELANQIPEFK